MICVVSRFGRGLVAMCAALGASGSGFAQVQEDPAKSVDFVTQIRPILEARCFECHSAAKQKGHLRLDRRASVFRSDDQHEWRIVPGDPDASELFYRISLPEDDFDIMPEKGDPLTTEQIALIRQWILEGAEWPEPEVTAPREPEPIAIRELSPAEEEAERAAVASITERGGLVLPIAKNTRALYVNLSLLREPFMDKDFVLLQGLEPTLAWINLGRSKITDAGAGELARYPELRRVNLNTTDVGDATVVLCAQLSHLQYLNLYGTRVSDIGAMQLAELQDLHRLYLWQTSVTERAVAQLREANPSLYIDLGKYALAAPESVETTVVHKEMTCCETALANGQLCVHTCCIEALANGTICEKCNPNPADELLGNVQALAKTLHKKADDK